MDRFHNFCNTYNVTSPFPLTEQLLCMYASYLADQQLTPQTIKSYLSAPRSWQISLGLPDPRDKSFLPMLKRVQAGISRLRLMKGSQAWIRLPITSHLLRQIKQALDRSAHPAKLVIWAVVSRAFFGYFRLGKLLLDSAQVFNESTCLSWGDVAVDNRSAPSMIQIYLKKSKCDQFGPRADVVVGITGDELCPVSAICQYLMLRGDKKGSFFWTQTERQFVSPGLWNSFAPSSAALGLLNISMPAIASGSNQLPLQQWPVSRILPSRPWGDGIVRPSYNRNAWHTSQSRWPRPANRRPSRHC